MTQTILTRFLDRVPGGLTDPDRCIAWQGSIQANGYGRFGRTTAHRAAYKLFVEDIPDSPQFVVDHLCRNRACVNPFHLELVGNRENTLRGALGRLRTHCRNGHELTTENTIVEGPLNHRRCRVCRSAQRRLADERRKASRLCIDCGVGVSRGAARCPKCSAIARWRDQHAK